MSRMNIPNSRGPIWLAVLLTKRPACFTERSWGLYLDGVRGDVFVDKTVRRSMERGDMPRYCEDCSPSHKKQMEAAARCFPQPEKRNASAA